MQGKRADFGNADCGIARALGVVGDWWSLLIVRDAFRGLRRFSEFHKSLGIAKNILSTRLKALVEHGVLLLESDGTSTRSHRYRLTPKGEELAVVLLALWQWGEAHCFEPGELQYATVDKAHRAPLAKLELRAEDGRVLGPREFTIADRPPSAAATA